MLLVFSVLASQMPVKITVGKYKLHRSETRESTEYRSRKQVFVTLTYLMLWVQERNSRYQRSLRPKERKKGREIEKERSREDE